MTDWGTLREEAVDLLRRSLMVDTTSPPGNEVDGARFLAEALGRDGIPCETAESAPGRGNRVARLRGDGSLAAVVLRHHIAVVDADRRCWSVDPFGGVIRDGDLYGGGALDMKSTGILQLVACSTATAPPSGSTSGSAPDSGGTGSARGSRAEPWPASPARAGR